MGDITNTGYTVGMRKRIAVYGFLLIVASAAASFWLLSRPVPDLPDAVRPVINQPAVQPGSQTFNKQQFSLDDPASQWVVVNKLRPLSPKEYVPADLIVPSVAMRVEGAQLQRSAARALESLFAAAEQAGQPLKLSSAYRSYNYQVGLYNGYVKSQGQSAADAVSARPGYSEHQTGLSADVGPLSGKCNVQTCFGDTPAGQWLAANAYKYGFIIRYPEGLTNITGYAYEPWHVRYVGTELAQEMQATGTKTLEEFFGLPPAPNYATN